MLKYQAIFALYFTAILHVGAQGSFVRVADGQFKIGQEPYCYLGANLWFGMYLAATDPIGDHGRLETELNTLQSLGIKNVRVMVAAEGPNDAPYRVQPALQFAPKKYDERLLEGIDRLLVELGKRDMKAVLCLNNFFQWSGGMAQYVSWATGQDIPYPHEPPYDWDRFQEFSADFFTNRKAKRWFRKYLRKVIKRTNKLSGTPYRDDPTIMAWQLANEPRGFSKVEAYKKWVQSTSAYIKKLDDNHLVSLGGEGFLSDESIGTAFRELSSCKDLDYLTMHLWVENWQWYKPAEPATYDSALVKAIKYLDRHLPVAQSVNKPIVLEEFGISRDGGGCSPGAATTRRDHFFTQIFEYALHKAQNGQALAGLNFWSWSGEGLPPRPNEMWAVNDPLTGDPPHEFQGWYSIYSADDSTLSVIQKYAEYFNSLSSQEAANH
jgi:mannan endo-1,4-beta-mannosidase